MVGKCVRVFAFTILAISATARADQPWTFNNNTRYLAMGDSLTAGQGATPVTNGYAYLLYQQGVYDSVTNTSFADAAVPGATSQQILSFQVPLATQTGFPQVITMTVGGNDLLSILNGANPQQVLQAFQLNRARSLASSASACRIRASTWATCTAFRISRCRQAPL